MNIVTGDIPSNYLKAAEQATIVGLDIETSGLLLHPTEKKPQDSIACIQMHVPEFGTIMVRYLNKVPMNLNRLIGSWKIRKIFQHAPFDLGFLLRDYSFMQPRHILDTKIAARILDPKRELFIDPDTNKGSHSLKVLVYHYFGYKMDKRIAVSNWFADDLTPEQLEYAAKDVEYLPPLLRKLEMAIFDKDPHLVNALNVAYHNIPAMVMGELKKAA